jgi:uncharacterized phiE125 gp8 family phage protein
MAATSALPGETPVHLNEARSWLRMGATIDDAVVAQLIRAATNICEAFIGQWLVVRSVEEVVPVRADALRLSARPVVAVDSLHLIGPDGGETELDQSRYRTALARDGTARLSIGLGIDAMRVRIAYRAGMAADANDIPEAIRQGIIRMIQHLYDARDGGVAAPPAAVAALWQPWRRLTLGAER